MSPTAPPRRSRSGGTALFQGLQKMGRSLQLPIAVLPAAASSTGSASPMSSATDGLGWDNVAKVMAGAGGALLDGDLGLPLLFCVGVAIGMAKKSDGSTALAAVAASSSTTTSCAQFPEDCAGGAKAVGRRLPGAGRLGRRRSRTRIRVSSAASSSAC